jgi:YVTN family beta-propeller protein
MTQHSLSSFFLRASLGMALASLLLSGAAHSAASSGNMKGMAMPAANATSKTPASGTAHKDTAAKPAATPANDSAVAAPLTPYPGMPPVKDPKNLYSEAGTNMLSDAVKNDLPRVYVPNLRSGTVSVIDPSTFKVVDTFKVGDNPQHVIPAWDLNTLWVAGSEDAKKMGSLTPIDPKTGKPGTLIPVKDAYNMYFTPDGKYAIVVAEGLKQLEFRDAHTMKLDSVLDVPQCGGINHADYAIDGSYAIFTCEFTGGVAKIDILHRKVLGYLTLMAKGMPQDIRVSPDGKKFYVADMMADGVHVLDGAAFKKIGFIKTAIGAHGLYPSRDGKKLYITNRGSHSVHGKRHGPGSISVMDFASEKIEKNWPIPGGGSPDMGNVTADGKWLWISGRFDDVVYAINTDDGSVKIIPVEGEPHGLTVWPQPGRYSLGHTGNMR